VGNGEAAVRKLADVKPDLVLADVFMPVRNGYEVCKYVKDDPAFAHIPVILLVGAFDPLDEQEAQRVGADGVLKKPFVPPDPLISMVKSALARAGVLVGAAAEEKAKETARNAADLLRASTAAKLAAIQEAKLPVAEVEPVEEEFPPMPAPVKIDANQGPVAFGSLLGTTETEEDEAAFVPAGKGLPLERNWGTDNDDIAEVEEEEEEAGHGGWRPAGLDAVEEPAAAVSGDSPDWREEAFHGSSPARNGGGSSRWTPSAEKHQIAEVAQAPAVGVSTLKHKPAEMHEAEQANAPAPVPVPFSSDAWAAAMAAGVEEKLAATEEFAAETGHVETAAPEAIAGDVTSHEMLESVGAAELEAAASANVVAEPENAATTVAESEVAPVQIEHQPAETTSNWFSVPPSPWDQEARKVSQLAATWDLPPVAEKSPEETQEIPPYQAPHAVSEETDVALEAEETAPVEAVPEEHAQAPSESAALAPDPIRETVFPAESSYEGVAESTSASTSKDAPALEPSATAPAAEPNMDELVGRVLAKMNPDLLQKVTREILKPIIEALVQDELHSKKS
jgi:CheY-like chemotaxis protein